MDAVTACLLEANRPDRMVRQDCFATQVDANNIVCIRRDRHQRRRGTGRETAVRPFGIVLNRPILAVAKTTENNTNTNARRQSTAESSSSLSNRRSSIRENRRSSVGVKQTERLSSIAPADENVDPLISSSDEQQTVTALESALRAAAADDADSDMELEPVAASSDAVLEEIGESACTVTSAHRDARKSTEPLSDRKRTPSKSRASIAVSPITKKLFISPSQKSAKDDDGMEEEAHKETQPEVSDAAMANDDGGFAYDGGDYYDDDDDDDADDNIGHYVEESSKGHSSRKSRGNSKADNEYDADDRDLDGKKYRRLVGIETQTTPTVNGGRSDAKTKGARASAAPSAARRGQKRVTKVDEGRSARSSKAPDAKGVRRATLMPISPPAGAVRRSQRKRCRPLEFWRGERVVYRRGDDSDCPVVVDVLVRSPMPTPFRRRPRKNIPSDDDDEDASGENESHGTENAKTNKKKAVIEDEDDGDEYDEDLALLERELAALDDKDDDDEDAVIEDEESDDDDDDDMDSDASRSP